MKAAFAELSSLYEATADQLDAFSLAGYIEDVQSGDHALSEEELKKQKRKKQRLPKGSDYRAVLNTFPEPRLARKIFTTMENARIDGRLHHAYRGLRKDLDLMKQFLRASRPYIFDLPMHLVPFELRVQITMCGGATDDARQFYGQVVSEIEGVVENFLKDDGFRKDEGGRMKDESSEEESTSASSFIPHPSSLIFSLLC